MVIGGLAAFIGQVMDFSATAAASLEFLDLTASKEVAEKALLSGEPTVLYCVDDATEAKGAPSVIADIKKELLKSKHSEGAQVRHSLFSSDTFATK